MRKILPALAFLLCGFSARAQTFTWNGYVPIQDFETDTIPVEVSGLPSAINSGFGVHTICFDLSHSHKASLVISLQAPDGTMVTLAENQGGSSDIFTGTCVALDGVPFSLGTPPFTGTFLPTGNIANFNNGQNPNGTWKLLVRDEATADTGSVHSASITFSNDPPQGQGVGNSGNLGPAGPFVRGGLVCPGGASGCDLLPDMTASAKEIFQYHHEYPGRLTVSNGTPNIGYGPLEIFAIDSCFCDGVPSPCNQACPNNGELQRIIRQRIYRKIPGTDTLGFFDRDAGAMTFHPEHGHLHVDNWADITLRAATSDPDPRHWPIIGTSVKQSYCLINLGTCAGNPGECVDNNGNTILTVPNNHFGFQTGCGFNQGIYPGDYDVYNEGLNEPILLDNVCNGNYYIVSITDPENHFLESDTTNNWVAVPVTLTNQNSTPKITSDFSPQLCDGDSIILSSSFAGNYLWSTGDTSRSIVVTTPGSYTVATPCGSSLPFEITTLPSGAEASVSIAITEGTNPTCQSATLSFTATPLYGGTQPIYDWYVNGVAQGVNSNIFTSSTLTDGAEVYCSMTSNISCKSHAAVSSDTITVAVTAAGDPSVTITQTKGANPQCLGDSATFTAQVQNGFNITYQWKLDGVAVGTNSNQYTNNALVNGNRIQCEVNATATCPLKVTIGNGTGSNSTTSCLGAAYPSYYGNGRQQYLVTGAELSAMGLVPGDITSLSFTVGGTLGNPATLNGYSIKLATTTLTDLPLALQTPVFTTVFGPVNYTPALNSINTHNFIQPFYWNGSSNLLVDICFENQVIGRRGYQNLVTVTPFNSNCYYQADTTGGAGACTRTTASYRGTLRPNMTFAENGEKNLQSNMIRMSVNSDSMPTVKIAITTGSNPQCPGAGTVFTATPNNTGANPAYQWMKNGVDIDGETGNIYQSNSLITGDTIRCRMTSGLTCGSLQDVQSEPVIIDVALPLYTFTGSGDWSNAANWLNNKIPPTKLLPCSEILIDPMGNTECLLNVQQLITPGAKLTVAPGKKFRVQGNLAQQ